MRGELWAWHDFEKDDYYMVYNRRFLVEMCSPDGFKKSVEKGEGKIVKLKALEVPEKSN